MARNGSLLLGFLRSANRFGFFVANLAAPVTIFVGKQIIFTVFVSFRAVCFAFLSCPVSSAPQRKPRKVFSWVFVKNLSQRQSLSGPLLDRVRLHANAFCKLCQKVLLTFDSQVNGVSAVSLLLLSSGPATILRTVSKVIVNSFKGLPFRPFAHI